MESSSENLANVRDFQASRTELSPSSAPVETDYNSQDQQEDQDNQGIKSGGDAPESSAAIIGNCTPFPWSLKDPRKLARISLDDDPFALADSDIDSSNSAAHYHQYRPSRPQHQSISPSSNSLIVPLEVTEKYDKDRSMKLMLEMQQQQHHNNMDQQDASGQTTTRIEQLKSEPMTLARDRSVGYSSDATNLSRELSTSSGDEMVIEDTARSGKKKKSKKQESSLARKEKRKKCKKTSKNRQSRSGSITQHQMEEDLQRMRSKIDGLQNSQGYLQGSLHLSAVTSGSISLSPSPTNSSNSSNLNQISRMSSSSYNQGSSTTTCGLLQGSFNMSGPTHEPTNKNYHLSSAPPSRDGSSSPDHMLEIASPRDQSRREPLHTLTKSEQNLVQKISGEVRSVSPRLYRERDHHESNASMAPATLKRRKSRSKTSRSVSPSILASLSKSEQDQVTEIDRKYGVKDVEVKCEKKSKPRKRSSTAKTKKTDAGENLNPDPAIVRISPTEDARKVNSEKPSGRDNPLRESRRAGSPGLRVRKAERGSNNATDVGFVDAAKMVKEMNLDDGIDNSPRDRSIGSSHEPSEMISLLPTLPTLHTGQRVDEKKSIGRPTSETESAFTTGGHLNTHSSNNESIMKGSRIPSKSKENYNSQSSDKLASPKKVQSFFRNFSLSPASRQHDNKKDRKQYLIGDMTAADVEKKMQGTLPKSKVGNGIDVSLPTTLGRATSVPVNFSGLRSASKRTNQNFSVLTEEERDFLEEAQRTSKLGMKQSRRHRQNRRARSKPHPQESKKLSLLSDEEEVDEEYKAEMYSLESTPVGPGYGKETAPKGFATEGVSLVLAQNNRIARPGFPDGSDGNTKMRSHSMIENMDQTISTEFPPNNLLKVPNADRSNIPQPTNLPSRVVSMPTSGLQLESAMKKKSKIVKGKVIRKSSSLPFENELEATRQTFDILNNDGNDAERVDREKVETKHILVRMSSVQMFTSNGETSTSEKGIKKAPKRYQSIQVCENIVDKRLKLPDSSHLGEPDQSAEVPGRRGRSLERISSDEDDDEKKLRSRMTRRSTWDAAMCSHEFDSQNNERAEEENFRNGSKSPKGQGRFATFLGNFQPDQEKKHDGSHDTVNIRTKGHNSEVKVLKKNMSRRISPFNGRPGQSDALTGKGVSFGLRLSPFRGKSKNKDSPQIHQDLSPTRGGLPIHSTTDGPKVDEKMIRCIQLTATGHVATFGFPDAKKNAPYSNELT